MLSWVAVGVVVCVDAVVVAAFEVIVVVVVAAAAAAVVVFVPRPSRSSVTSLIRTYIPSPPCA